MRFDHAIFQGPRSVDTTTEKKIDEYTKKSIRAWRVQEDLKKPGLVATRRRFVGATDSEIISGGTNMKGDRGTPLVREGNLFLWGFSGSPTQMTAPGRAAFVNAITWMKGFDGQTPTRRIGTRERTRWRGVLDSPYVKPERLKTYFGGALRLRHGVDKAAYRADLEKSEPFLYVPQGTATWHVDADAQALGHPTSSLDLIRAAIKDGGERGQRVLDRYWPADKLVIARPGSIKELDLIADQVVFSERHGYRWLSRPPESGPDAREVKDAFDAMPWIQASDDAPVIFQARMVGGYNAKALAHDRSLGLVSLAVQARILEGWHVTLESGDTGLPPVEIEVELPKGMHWQADGFEVIGRRVKVEGAIEGHGTLTWTRPIWLRDVSPGTHTVKGLVRFQACNEASCLMATEMPFEAKIKVR